MGFYTSAWFVVCCCIDSTIPTTITYCLSYQYTYKMCWRYESSYMPDLKTIQCPWCIAVSLFCLSEEPPIYWSQWHCSLAFLVVNFLSQRFVEFLPRYMYLCTSRAPWLTERRSILKETPTSTTVVRIIWCRRSFEGSNYHKYSTVYSLAEQYWC